MIFLEIFYNSRMHISELTTMALIKNNNNMLHVHFVPGILFYKGSQFLNSSNDDMRILVFQLSF